MEKIFNERELPSGNNQKIAPEARKSGDSEAAIWRDFLRGSDLALANIYRNYLPRLYNYGRQLSKSDGLVRDCIQDVFFELLKNRKKLGEAVSVRFYLFASLRRRIFRQLNKYRKITLHEDMLNHDGFQFETQNDARYMYECFSPDQKKLLREACNRLPLRQREAVMLHYYEQLSYSEIAELMQLSRVKSARTLVYRALDSLNELLADWREELLILGMFTFLFGSLI